jgi:pimeloyl-ACP methyl ester carboxylesterase
LRQGYADTPEGQVHYRTEGNGEPLLLLHKAGLSSDEFTEMLPFLGKSYMVIAMDVLGYGNTALPKQEPKFNDYVQNIIHFMDAMKLKKINIAGHLLGSSFAMEIAATQPERVNKLILWDGIFLDEKERKATQDEYANEHMVLKGDGTHLLEVWKSRGGKPGANLPAVNRSTIEYLKSGLGEGTGASHRALFSYNPESQLPKIKAPTLLLYSSPKSPMLVRVDAMQAAIKNSEVKILNGVNPWEKPEELAKVIIDFLEN